MIFLFYNYYVHMKSLYIWKYIILSIINLLGNNYYTIFYREIVILRFKAKS